MPLRKDEDGIVHSSLKPRCIACNNCVLACPFGIPKMMEPRAADDEVRHVLRPHFRSASGPCARPSVPARRWLTSGPRDIARRREKPTNIFYFGSQKITTKVFMMAPAEREAIALDVVDYMWEEKP